ncbi:hypothetical protein LIV57_11795 [Chryseobacterium sp. X308]|uniref:hypothetical protein n=1 Tax=Chryseobacterium sp. X308 TaxID=2884873 RepID=UPI001D14A09A|nr:hypothetical protein [Chryseobacterium sp. X308]MCC3215947.1 hypothetical protein [Chryseobacterium sp. X308]
MKKTALYMVLLLMLSACTKSETQYIDQNNKRETVNDKASDTIQTLDGVSDTMQQESDSVKVKPDNE